MANFTENLAGDPLLRSYYFYSGILILKMLAMSILTGRQRKLNKAFANPEDAKVGGGKVQVNENVERVRRAHLNDLENIPIYFVASFAYICTAPAVGPTVWLMRAFTAARIIHTIVYAIVPLPQPARGLSWGIGFGITGYMAVSALLHFM